MSYILDALKKSEQERSRGTIPDIKTEHQPRPVEYKKSSPWPYVVLIVLLISAAGLGVVIYQQNMLRGADSSASIASSESLSTDAPPLTQPLSNEPAQILDKQLTQNILAQKHEASSVRQDPQVNLEKSQPDKSASEDHNSGKANVIFSDEPLTVSEKELKNAETIDDLSVLTDVQITAETGSSTRDSSEPVSELEDDKIYDIAELPDSVKRTLPAISFAGHVYSSTQSQRSVMLNGKKMREGQEVTKDLMLEEITIEGVVLRSQGYRFKLGALQDWSFQ